MSKNNGNGYHNNLPLDDDENKAPNEQPLPDTVGGENGTRDGDDGMTFFDWFGDWMGLPEEWDDADIPTYDDIEQTARQKLRRLAHKLEKSETPLSVEFLKEIAEELQNLAYISQALPGIYLFVFRYKDKLQTPFRLDIWRSILVALLLAILNNKDRYPQATVWISKIGSELGLTNWAFKGTDDAIIESVKQYIEYGQKSEKIEDVFLARCTYLKIMGGRLTIEDIENEMKLLLEDAKSLVKAKDVLHAKMSVYLAVGFAFNHCNIQDKAFTYGQQGFLIAHHLGDKHQELAGLSLMIGLTIANPKAGRYTRQLIAHLERDPDLLGSDRYMLFYYYGQVAPYLCCTVRNYPTAERYYRQALAIIGDQPLLAGRAAMLHGLGISLTHLKQYEEATQCFAEARTLYEQNGQLEYRASMTHAIAWVDQEQGCYADALVGLQMAHKETKAIKTKSDLRKRVLKAIREDIKICEKGLSGE